MIDDRISFVLPLPWENLEFEIDRIGTVNFLVGPNGSGKSKFAGELLKQLRKRSGGARLLSTDRLSGMEYPFLSAIIGDTFGRGLDESSFDRFKQAGQAGSGIDTFVLLEERVDLLIQIESTLSYLFDRDISLKWVSGRLMPMVERRNNGEPYRLDRDECHGIRELLVLLTHLYDDKVKYFIVDEPELNLHPQYQAFFMQEVRKKIKASAVGNEGKIVFLITHSPFILDLQSEDDLNSTILFDRAYSKPQQVARLDIDFSSFTSSTARFDTHHKQLFFSDNPIFVEGPHDASILQALMEARGASVAGAGSCIIHAGGVEQVNQYLRLCVGLGKQAHFLYDLDSLFRGKLRSFIQGDESIQSFLALAGLGSDVSKAFSFLEGDIRELIENLPTSFSSPDLEGLQHALNGLGHRNNWGHDGWSKARVAVMTALSLYREDMAAATCHKTIEAIEGRRGQLLAALESRNIQVLSGGTLERYLPHFKGDLFKLTPEAKQQAVEARVARNKATTATLRLRKRKGVGRTIRRTLRQGVCSAFQERG